MMQVAGISQAVEALQQGKVIAYPTEAVFGLGCDPDNESAIQTLLDLKQRDETKGLIIIASEVGQLYDYIAHLDNGLWQKALASWPGPITWLIPAKPNVSRLVTGAHENIAVRVTAHPVAKTLCATYGKPIISTSANKSAQQPARSVDEVLTQFGENIQTIVAGEVDLHAEPSQIRDLLTDQVIRG